MIKLWGPPTVGEETLWKQEAVSTKRLNGLQHRSLIIVFFLLFYNHFNGWSRQSREVMEHWLWLLASAACGPTGTLANINSEPTGKNTQTKTLIVRVWFCSMKTSEKLHFTYCARSTNIWHIRNLNKSNRCTVKAGCVPTADYCKTPDRRYANM